MPGLCFVSQTTDIFPGFRLRDFFAWQTWLTTFALWDITSTRLFKMAASCVWRKVEYWFYLFLLVSKWWNFFVAGWGWGWGVGKVGKWFPSPGREDISGMVKEGRGVGGSVMVNNEWINYYENIGVQKRIRIYIIIQKHWTPLRIWNNKIPKHQ